MSTTRRRGITIPTLAIAVGALAAQAAVPNDPDWPLQWGLHNIGQTVEGQEGVIGADIGALAAWEIHQGTSSVLVAIVGSGVDPHPEFADRLLPGIATIGDPFDTRDACPQDTHLAGVIAATTGDGAGVAGLNRFVRILPVRVLEGCSGSEEAAVEGMLWAVDQGADVILVPLQFYGKAQLLEAAIAYATANDVVVVAPTGTEGDDEVALPAALDDCLAVSGTTNLDTLSPDSSFGVDVDLAAPGLLIWSTWTDGEFGYLEPPRDSVAAAAFVAGVASLVRSYAPQLSGAEVRQLLLDSADDLGDPGWDHLYGAGRVNARRALDLAPAPALRFEQTEGLPTLVDPDRETTFQVHIVDVAEGVVIPLAALYYRHHSGEFIRSSLTHLGGSLFEARLPTTPCLSGVEYYLSAVGDGGSVVTHPLNAPATVYNAEALVWLEKFADDFEQDGNWEVEGGDATNGRWSRVDPVGTAAQPEYDASPGDGSYCYVTGQHFGGHDGTNDVDGGPVVLTSPVIQLGSQDAEISHFRWFHCSGTGEEDFLTVEMSRDNGSTWVHVETVASTDVWAQAGFRLSDFPEATGDQLRVRFSTSDSPSDSLTEAAIDEFRVREIHCSSVGGDGNGDGVVDLVDYGDLYDCWTGPVDMISHERCLPFEFDSDGHVDLFDYHAFQRVFEPQ